MKWQPPKERTVNMLVAPLAILAAIAAAVVILPCVPIWWALDKYERRLFDKGWHRWFAWRPVKTGEWHEGDRRWVWLEKVERCACTYPHRKTVYRVIEAMTDD